MQQNASDVMKYLEESSKRLSEWFEDNQMMRNLDKSHLLLRGTDIKSTMVYIFSIKSSSKEN